MGAALKVLDDKVADLESENDTLREERVILREKVRVSSLLHLMAGPHEQLIPFNFSFC